MIPNDLIAREINLPETDQATLAIITCSGLSHQRFSYRIQQEFGDRVVAWYQLDDRSAFRQSGGLMELYSALSERGMRQIFGSSNTRRIRNYLKRHGVFQGALKAASHSAALCQQKYWWWSGRIRQHHEDERLLGPEIRELKHNARLKPIPVSDPHSQSFISDIHRLSPYLFLSLGGPIYRQALLDGVRGLPINLHAGWSPDYKGSHTLMWALYHRRLDRFGSTVHVTTADVDGGPILRRGFPALLAGDNLETCMARAVISSTEMAIDAVHEILSNRRITAFEQDRKTGRTYRTNDLTQNVIQAVRRDFASGWLSQELSRLRQVE